MLDETQDSNQEEATNKVFFGGLGFLVIVGAVIYMVFGRGQEVSEVPLGQLPSKVVTTTNGEEITNKQAQDVDGKELLVEVGVTGSNFAFSQDTIIVRKGSKVVVEFESTEGFHDFVIDEFSASTDQVRPGAKTSVEFVVSEVGEFEYYCSVGNHRELGMVGTLIVTE